MIRTLEVSTDSTKRHAGTNKLQVGDTAWDLIDNWGKNLSHTAVWMRKGERAWNYGQRGGWTRAPLQLEEKLPTRSRVYRDQLEALLNWAPRYVKWKEHWHDEPSTSCNAGVKDTEPGIH